MWKIIGEKLDIFPHLTLATNSTWPNTKSWIALDWKADFKQSLKTIEEKISEHWKRPWSVWDLLEWIETHPDKKIRDTYDIESANIGWYMSSL